MNKFANTIIALQESVGSDSVLTGSEVSKWKIDWTGEFVSDPLAVVRPTSTQDVSKVLQLANKHGFSVVPVSGNTGVTGGTSANGAVLLSLDRMTAIRSFDKDGRVAIVEAGVVLADLRAELEKDDLTFPLSFGAEGSAMIGGCLATNAGGSNVLRYGNARDLCMGLEVVMPDGAIMNILSKLHKDNSGYDLRDLMIGSEGTLGIITAAALKLFSKPKAFATAMIATTDLGSALKLLNELQDATNGSVEAFEYMPRSYIDAHLRHDSNAREPFEAQYDVNILVEIGATASRDATQNQDGSLPIINSLIDTLERFLEDGFVLDAVVASSDLQRQEMWSRREVAIELARAHKVVLPNDVAVPLEDVPNFLNDTGEALSKLDSSVKLQIVSHLGDGNIHYVIQPSITDPDTLAKMKTTVEQNVVKFDGSFSAEHGIGLTKKETMARLKDPVALRTMREIKRALDPNNVLNPGKVLP